MERKIKKFSKVKDSGKRQQFNTGSQRDTSEGKGRFDLIPFYPLMRLAQHYENGAVKYHPNNWKLGQPLSRYLDSAFRHLYKVLDGWEDEDHASAVAWNIFSFIETQRLIEKGDLPEMLNDIPYTVKNVKKTMWKDIKKAPNYQVNMLGEVMNIKRQKLLKPYDNKHGYRVVALSASGVVLRRTVHRLVMEAFRGERPKGLVINHINGDKTDNTLDNLEYCTQSENLYHAYATGLKIPTKHSAKIKKEEVIKIRKAVKRGKKQTELAKQYNLSPQTINDLIKRRTWKDV